MNNYMKSRQGLTLIELVIVIVILGTILTIATTMIIQAFNIVGDGTRRMNAKQLAEIHLTEISKYVRNAEEIVEDDNKITVDEKDIKLDENNNIVKNGDILIYNIKEFIIDEPENGVYTIKITVGVDEEEATVTRKVSPRN